MAHRAAATSRAPDDHPPWWLIPVILSSLIGLTHIGHYGWTDPDEIVHAAVATNLASHWLEPTLHDIALGDANLHWQRTQVWLHKPIVPLWMSALSIKILGHTPFAFRLPALVLQQCTIALTYLIGLRLYGRWTGLVAASLAAVLPFSYSLLFGGQFSDIYDIGLTFWTALGVVLFIQATTTGKLRYHGLLGVTVGLGYLSKWEMGLFPLGLVLFFGLLRRTPISWTRPRRRRRPIEPAGAGRPLTIEGLRGIGASHLGLALLAAAATALPWLVYIAVRYPVEFAHEHGMILAHLSEDVEGWSRPWYYHLWPYLSEQHTPVFAVAILASFAATVLRWFHRRSPSDLLVVVCVLGVFVPLSVATSKVVGGTYMIYAVLLVMVSRTAVQVWSWLGRRRVVLVSLLVFVVGVPAWKTTEMAIFASYDPVPIRGLAWHVNRTPGFDDAYFLLDSHVKTPKDDRFMLDHFQLAFFTGTQAYRLWRDVELQESLQILRDRGYHPYVVSEYEWPDYPVVLQPEGSIYTVYDPP